ncbi:NAD(P)-dependent oxidoreductase [SAR86 cluster bacterium]|nr:NAD(P)-dependent oxidoreductase [SAR86 cluster bacterium]
MSSIVLLGASGFLGHNFLLYKSFGYEIKAVRRNKNDMSIKYEGVTWYDLDISSPGSLAKILSSDDIVINLIYASNKGRAYNLSILENIVKACSDSQVKRLIHCSTAVVTGNVKDTILDEDIVCKPTTDYEKIKIELEYLAMKVNDSGVDVGILRPTAIVGEGGGNLKILTESLLSKKKFIPYLKSLIIGSRRMHLVPVKNVVKALESMSFYKSPLNGEIYNISCDADQHNTYREVERIISRTAALKYRPPKINLPKTVLFILLFLIGRRDNNINTIYKSDKIKSLGYTDVNTVEESVEDYVDWYKKINN